MVNHRGCGQTAGVLALLVGLTALCLPAAGIAACQGLSATRKELHACAPLAVLGSHSTGVLLAQRSRSLTLEPLI